MTKEIDFINYLKYSTTVIGLPFDIVDSTNTLIHSMLGEIHTRYGSEEHAVAISKTLAEIQSVIDRNLDEGARYYAGARDVTHVKIRLSAPVTRGDVTFQTLMMKLVTPIHDCNAVFTMSTFCLLLDEDLKTWKAIGLLVEPQCETSVPNAGPQTKPAAAYALPDRVHPKSYSLPPK